MKIACEMQVYILHGNDLRIASARRAAFDAENRSERRLTKRKHRIFPYSAKSVRKTDCGCGFALSRRCRSYSRNQNQLSLRIIMLRKERKVDFRLGLTVGLNISFVYPRGFCDFINIFGLYRLSYFYIRHHFGHLFQILSFILYIISHTL